MAAVQLALIPFVVQALGMAQITDSERKSGKEVP